MSTPGRPSLAALTSPEAARATGGLVLVPAGAVEQHGPHLPLGTDIWIATAVARAAADEAGALVSEPLPIGCSAHHRSFPGTLSLTVETFQRIVCEVATTLAADGFTPVFVNGHGGNRAPLGAALQELAGQGVTAWAVSYFDLVAEEAEELFGHESLGHACALETSLVLHLWPELVRRDLVPDAAGGDAFPDPFLFSRAKVVRHRPFEDFGADGVVGAPRLADAAAGERLFNSSVRHLVNCMERIGHEADHGRTRSRE
ncbi:MAG: creatininase family protein [Propionibacteriaceae bacterium]